MTSPGDAVTVLSKDNTTKATLTKGGTLVVKLEAIPGTGYSWQIAKNDGELLKPIGNPHFEKSEKGTVGGTEIQVFTFKGLTPGSTHLELHYLRSWEKLVAPAKTFRLEVQIR